MTGIVTLPLVPLRISDSELSEMTSQLLFGECIEILEIRENWLSIRNLSDNYSGWIDRKMIKILSDNQAISYVNIAPYCVSVPLLNCKNSSGENVIIPGGSLLPAFTGGKCKIDDEIFTVESGEQIISKPVNGDQICNLAKQYLNAPFLWGGKSIFGIDSSGLVQLVFSIGGIYLPRDSFHQVECGQVIDFLSEAKAGDLAFFENTDGEIVHVGIMLNNNQIIHSSGSVKIETIDYQGIISTPNGKYTHKLRVIKRLI